MSNGVSSDIYELLKNVVNNKIDNYSIHFHGSNKKGEGYLGEMKYISLKDKNGGKELNFVVKQALSDARTRDEFRIRSYYVNEIEFYKEVWPALQNFQRKIQSLKAFDKIPRCFATATEDKREKLILENLRYQNFVTFDKKRTLDKEHVEFIFKQYGRFHGVSFAYKELNPQEFSEISKGLEELWCLMSDVKSFQSFIKYIHELCLQTLHPEKDAEVIEKYKHYVDDGVEIFYNSNIYKGNYAAVLHGDCWSNNMMFKYDEGGKLIDMRLIDFQFSKVGTPVSDLSYCLYSGGSKEILDDLDYYLKVYHDSVLVTVRELGCNSDNVYPFEELKNDWKQYCKMGFSMGLMLWRSKLTHDDSVIDFTDITDDVEDITGEFAATKYDEVAFNRITRDLILHMYENDFL